MKRATPAAAAPELSDTEFVITTAERGRPIDGVLRAHLSISWGRARALVERGKVQVDGVRATNAAAPLVEGARIEVRPHGRRTDRTRLADEAIAYVDPHLVVVHKPPGISTIPYPTHSAPGRGALGPAGGEPTMEALTRAWLVHKAGHSSQASLGVVHRIDKETSGLVVFARTFAAKKRLSQAFRVHAIDRRYIALVHGAFAAMRTFRSHLVEDRGDGLRGSLRDQTLGARLGQLAITHVAPLDATPVHRSSGPAATAVACKLETGRTHQIRIHLAEAGFPLVGEKVYTRDWGRAGQILIEAPRLMLHAMVLGFSHPITGKPLVFTEPLPADMRAAIARLLGSGTGVAGELAVDPSRLPL